MCNVQLYIIHCTLYIVHCTIVHTQSSLNFLRTGMILLCGVNLLFRLYCPFVSGKILWGSIFVLVHCCILSLCYLGAETDDYQKPNYQYRDHLVGQLTILSGVIFLKRLYYVECNCLKLHFVGFIFC